VFHLLNAATDASAFPMRRRASTETAGDLIPAIVDAPATIRAEHRGSVDPHLLAGSAAGPTLATSWHGPILCCGLFSIALVVGAATAGDVHAQSAPPSSRAEKIANALTAAPEELTRDATVRDWPAKEGGGFAVLRQGTNGWVCLPDDAMTRGNDPMCMDDAFFGAVSAYFAGQVPKFTRVAYAYMLTSDAEGSNTDPRAQGPTPTNQWHHAGPHVMVAFPDPKLIEGLPAKPTAFGPYVMFPGTPIAHVMLPVQSGYAHAGPHKP
jgi:hypothetical protein